MKAVRILAAGLLAAVLGLLGTLPAQAQFGGGGGGMPPGMMHKIQEWQQWRQQHKNLSNLQTMLYQLQQLEKDPQHHLNKKQAAGLIGILKAWRHKPNMTEQQAHQVQVKIGNLLTLPQIQKMTTFQPAWNANRSGGGGGGFKPGAKFTFPDPPRGGYNPLNPDTLPFKQMRPVAAHTMAMFMQDLAHRAKTG